jgi:putative hemolysin
MVNLLRVKYDEEKPFFGVTDLNQYLKSLYRVKPETEDIELDKKIFHNALEFKTVKIRDCMIPRTEITAVEVNDSIEKLREAFVESGHSKVIVYKQSIDEIVGYCHSSSLFKKPKQIKDILTPIIIVAETALANELMIRFINERKSLAVVVDEFGGTSGIVSMEDVIEEIFGEIEDEHDEEDQLIEQKLGENTYLLSARLEIDYLNDTYHWELPTGEYETLGGLILSYTEDFPKQGQTILLPPFTFIIQTTGDNRIDTVMVSIVHGP